MATKYVTIKKMADLTGYSEQAIRDKIYQGVWSFPIIRKAPDNRVLINLEEYDKWVEMEEVSVPPPKAQLKSPSCIRELSAKKDYHLSPPPLT